MPRKASIGDRLEKDRPPRVHIKYSVEVGNAIEEREIPFVVGVLGDFTGKPDGPQKPIKQREFVDLSSENFDKVMAGLGPRVAFKVDNKLTGDDSKMGVELRFKSMEDFTPENVANQIEPLRKLLEVRQQLTALLAKTDGNDRLAEQLQEIITNTDKLEQIAKQSGIGGGGSGGSGGDEGESNG